MIGSHTQVGNNAHISASVIGQRCTIGADTIIRNAYIFDDTVIGPKCVIEYSIVGAGVHIKEESRVEKGCLVGDGVTIGPRAVLLPFERLSKRREKPETDEDEDDDEDEDEDDDDEDDDEDEEDDDEDEEEGGDGDDEEEEEDSEVEEVEASEAPSHRIWVTDLNFCILKTRTSQSWHHWVKAPMLLFGRGPHFKMTRKLMRQRHQITKD